MSSCQSFLRQRVVGTTTLSAPANGYYVLVAGGGNYVGNYPSATAAAPPSYMVASSPAIPVGAVLRDMGKTIKCGISADSGATVGAAGFFREVQVLSFPGGVAANAAFGIGAGVQGSGAPYQLPAALNAGDAGYNTYYIPIQVGGVVPATSGTNPAPLAVSTAGLIVGAQL
jgi:hypothetical protein